MEPRVGMEVHEILIELKYCERCGGLWLRPQGSGAVYCAGCQEIFRARQSLALTPALKPQRRKWRSQGAGRQKDDVRSSGGIDYLEGVAMIEVLA